jgi:putative ABC transport system substrate-binding protein
MRSCGHLVDRVLGGAAPGDLPVVAHEGILLRVNLAVAGDLGLTIPQSILDRASDVISE